MERRFGTVARFTVAIAVLLVLCAFLYSFDTWFVIEQKFRARRAMRGNDTSVHPAAARTPANQSQSLESIQKSAVAQAKLNPVTLQKCNCVCQAEGASDGRAQQWNSDVSHSSFGWLYKSPAVPPSLVCGTKQLEVLWNQACVPMLPLPQDIRPVLAYNVSSAQSTKAQQLQQLIESDSRKNVRFHWVIKSCPRRAVNRVLLSSIMSGLFNGLDAATISIVWCEPPGSKLPYMLYNLRLSNRINIFHVPEKLNSYWKPLASTLTALQIPKALGNPELPLLITEDDVLYAPDANSRIAAAVTKVQPIVGADPFSLHFYWGEMVGQFDASAPDADSSIQNMPNEYNMPIGGHNMSQEPLVNRVVVGTLWGTQCQFYSSTMTQMLAQHVYMSYKAISEGELGTFEDSMIKHLEDIVIDKGLRIRMKCNEPGVPCHALIIQPSLVQHVGTSSTHSGNDTRSSHMFHYAKEFPMHVKFPTMENDTRWK